MIPRDYLPLPTLILERSPGFLTSQNNVTVVTSPSQPLPTHTLPTDYKLPEHSRPQGFYKLPSVQQRETVSLESERKVFTNDLLGL